jgi:hypothetical protein
LNAWVTEESRIRVPRVTDPASGVSTSIVWPYAIVAGAEVMVEPGVPDDEVRRDWGRALERERLV